jgi:hypothetical protein
VRRRRFFELAAGASAAWLGRGCGGDVPGAAGPTAPAAGPSPGPTASAGAPAILTPKVNGGINVPPLRRLDLDPNNPVTFPGLVALQLRTVYELGFDGIRIAAPYTARAEFLAAVPYVRAARALGIDVVLVLADFGGFLLARELRDDRRRPRVLKLFSDLFATPPHPAAPGAGGRGPGGVGRIAFQVLNEPALFVGLPPDVYVNQVLRPCFTELHAINPQIIVVSAAEVGTLDGPPRVRAMLEAGLEDCADRIAFHIYNPDVIPLLSNDVRGLVWVTESGVADPSLHLGWVRDVFPRIRAQIDDVSRIFLWILYETDPRRFRLVDIQPDGPGFRVLPESAELLAFFAENVARAAAGAPVQPFDSLVPDIGAYFPTAADVALYDQVYFG